MRTRRHPPLLGFAQGLLMGGADVIPGVSGGTVALIVGIYAELIGSIRAAASAPIALLRGDVGRARERLTEVRWDLVLPLGTGILLALAVGFSFLPQLLERYPELTSAVFFGLIAGSLVVPWRRITRRDLTALVVAVAAAVAAFVLTGLPPRQLTDPTPVQIFGGAAIAICAMILPGISGSFLLVVLGLYVSVGDAVRGFDLGFIAIFGAGCVIGLGLFSKLLEFLLARHHDRTMAALVGLMAGSLRALWPWQDADRGLLAPQGGVGGILAVLALALLGYLAVTVLVRVGARTEERLVEPIDIDTERRVA